MTSECSSPSIGQESSGIDSEPFPDGGDRRRVDLWALDQQAHSTDMALTRASDKTGHVTNAIYQGDVDELGVQDLHYAWAALRDARNELVLLAHLAGYDRLDINAVDFGEATDEEMDRFERRREGDR